MNLATSWRARFSWNLCVKCGLRSYVQIYIHHEVKHFRLLIRRWKYVRQIKEYLTFSRLTFETHNRSFEDYLLLGKLNYDPLCSVLESFPESWFKQLFFSWIFLYSVRYWNFLNSGILVVDICQWTAWSRSCFLFLNLSCLWCYMHQTSDVFREPRDFIFLLCLSFCAHDVRLIANPSHMFIAWIILFFMNTYCVSLWSLICFVVKIQIFVRGDQGTIYIQYFYSILKSNSIIRN